MNTIAEKTKRPSLSPIEFSKGLLAKLSELKTERIGFYKPSEKAAAQAVFDVFESRVRSIKGNEAKSPRYRELLRIRNVLAPGVLQEFGAFRHSVFQAMTELRDEIPAQKSYPFSTNVAEDVLKKYTKEDLVLIDACAKAYNKVYQNTDVF